MRRRSALRAGRRMIDKLRARWDMTPQERAHRYVSQMPIAVLGTTAELR
ncbi:MAG: hypothetical protein JO236_17915 [Mycobacterium sp.]|nr:hypothetical protein [Mycobacterium sp.]MBW0019409.1 hypothetical protein [Mycobacterium sp.]